MNKIWLYKNNKMKFLNYSNKVNKMKNKIIYSLVIFFNSIILFRKHQIRN